MGRIWMAADGSLITDEQLLRHIATFGSLSAALRSGDVTLVISSKDKKAHGPGDRPKIRSRLSDYIGGTDS